MTKTKKPAVAKIADPTGCQ